MLDTLAMYGTPCAPPKTGSQSLGLMDWRQSNVASTSRPPTHGSPSSRSAHAVTGLTSPLLPWVDPWVCFGYMLGVSYQDIQGPATTRRYPTFFKLQCHVPRDNSFALTTPQEHISMRRKGDREDIIGDRSSKSRQYLTRFSILHSRSFCSIANAADKDHLQNRCPPLLPPDPPVCRYSQHHLFARICAGSYYILPNATCRLRSGPVLSSLPLRVPVRQA
ncbi:hypothetical protein ARMGADRAFT_1092339 [Armillaria gallica]|uniref:Uncharacterized protein n=1 Tax=Armillaria gallica TaxID=47427 RepID=A0A2H3CW42_ARMGA|nr:hypothetical protein ARMGADRAFT_1092339 [Armillaria gallica]